jgi:hypothetical protein
MISGRLGSGSLYRKIISTNFFDRTSFDRKVGWPTPFDRTPFDWKIIWPKHHLTKSSFTEKVIWPKTFVKWSLTEKTFGQMNFRSKDHFQKKLSVKWIFAICEICAIFFRSDDIFCRNKKLPNDQMTIFWRKKSVIWPFGKMNFRSNGVWLNGDTVKWTFG